MKADTVHWGAEALLGDEGPTLVGAPQALLGLKVKSRLP